MSCSYVGELRCSGPECDSPVGVWACHLCPGGVLVLDPDAHQHDAHPPAAAGSLAPPAATRIPAPRSGAHDHQPRAAATRKDPRR